MKVNHCATTTIIIIINIFCLSSPFFPVEIFNFSEELDYFNSKGSSEVKLPLIQNIALSPEQV